MSVVEIYKSFNDFEKDRVAYQPLITDHCVVPYAIPKYALRDNGTQFFSKFFQSQSSFLGAGPKRLRRFSLRRAGKPAALEDDNFQAYTLRGETSMRLGKLCAAFDEGVQHQGASIYKLPLLQASTIMTATWLYIS